MRILDNDGGWRAMEATHTPPVIPLQRRNRLVFGLFFKINYLKNVFGIEIIDLYFWKWDDLITNVEQFLK
jgi:hypothetical protein